MNTKIRFPSDVLAAFQTGKIIGLRAGTQPHRFIGVWVIVVRERVFGMIVEEFERTRRMILKLTGQPELLSGNPVLARSIRLRNPYVDPLSLIQFALLRRKQEGEESEDLNYALAATINGIAAGLRNTG